MQLVSKNRNVHTYSRGPVAGSFQSKLWPRRRASALEAALLASRAFALVFSWYNVIIALSLCLSSGALQHTVNTSIIAAKIVQKQAPLFRSGLEAPPLKKKTALPIRSVQNADCRPGSKCRLSTKCRLGTKCRLRIYTVFSSDTWSQHVILQLTERHAIAFPRSSFTIICTIVA